MPFLEFLDDSIHTKRREFPENQVVAQDASVEQDNLGHFCLNNCRKLQVKILWAS